MSVAWESSGNDPSGHGSWKHDSNAFLFSLVNKDHKPCKMKPTSHDGHNSIYCHSSYGPRFNNDIYISNNANHNRESYSNLGCGYKHSEYINESSEAKSFLAGSYKFQLSEIEVYSLHSLASKRKESEKKDKV